VVGEGKAVDETAGGRHLLGALAESPVFWILSCLVALAVFILAFEDGQYVQQYLQQVRSRYHLF
jgi:hypothetical protein